MAEYIYRKGLNDRLEYFISYCQADIRFADYFEEDRLLDWLTELKEKYTEGKT